MAKARKGNLSQREIVKYAAGGTMIAAGAALTAFGITAEIGIPLALAGAGIIELT